MTTPIYERFYEAFQIPGGALVGRSLGVPDLGAPIIPPPPPPSGNIRGRMTRADLRTPVGGVLPDRTTLVAGTYNPLDYAGPTAATKLLPPHQQEWLSTNRVGIFGSSSITSKVDANITFSTAGGGASNTVFYGKVSVTAANVTFNNCLFAGSATQDTECVAVTNAGATNTTFIDCTFTAQAWSRWKSGCIVGTGKATYIRCDFYNLSDSITPGNRWTAGVVVQQSAFHDAIMGGPDPGAAGGIDDAQTHVDETQFIGGSLEIYGSGYSGLYINNDRFYQGALPSVDFGGSAPSAPYHFFGNRYYPSIHTTSCVMMSPATYPLDTVKMHDNYFDGAVFPINCAGMTSVNNVFQFYRNKCGNNRRNPTGAGNTTSYKTIIAVAALQSFIDCPSSGVNANVQLNDGTTVLTKAQIVQNG